MCFDHDSQPPIAPVSGGAADSSELTVESADGTPFSAFIATAATPTGAGIVILPDVRGLHPYYIQLALRFAEHGVHAIAIDYFGRTAGLGVRDADFEYMPHVTQTTFAGQSADLSAASAHLSAVTGTAASSQFTIGFCFGGRFAFLSTTLGLDLAGAIGFYGWPVGTARNDMPAPADVADRVASPVLGVFGGADPGISATDVATFENALTPASATHEIVTYPDAPHSFFDRKAADFAGASDDAWSRVLGFIRSNPT